MGSESIWDKLAKAETASSAQRGGGRKIRSSKPTTPKANTSQKKTVRHLSFG
jgi:hypothetical protein